MSPVAASPHRRLGVVRTVLVAGVVALLLGGLSACGEDAPAVAPLSAADVKGQLADPPKGLTPAERKLEREASQTIDGGRDPAATLDAELKALRGTPVVVNLWGDWCVPCRKELPIFQRVALDRRGEVAFLGVAVNTTAGKTQAYLDDQIFLPYPSIIDPDGKVNIGTGVDNVPKTLFYDAAGKRTVHIGPYESEADLVADIQRYAS